MIGIFGAFAFIAGMIISILFSPIHAIGAYALAILCAIGAVEKKLTKMIQILEQQKNNDHWANKYK